MQEIIAANSEPPVLLTVGQFAAKHIAWSPAALRALILNATVRKNSRGEVVSGNGLDVAIIRIGRRVLISERGFFQWVAAQSKRTKAA